ncbi:MAG: hypothetical protein PHG40_05515 [Candidatus Omnitrophica bacterium]|nr:hypothetical protein [Candidatus Omnitrophota bacterium]
MKLDKRQKILIAFAAAVILIFFAQKVVFTGFVAKLNRLNSQIKLEEEKLKRGLAVQKGKDKVTRDYKKYSPYLGDNIPEKELSAVFLNEVENISKISGVSLVSLNPTNDLEVTKDFKRLKADFRLDTDMESLFMFLDKVQESKLLMKIDKISLAARDEESGVIRVEASISMIVPL